MVVGWIPREMRVAPELDWGIGTGEVRRRSALLINPFYPKDPHASFGKHVLTPSLALTSVAAATPSHWEVRYWDENLLQGGPQCDPVPEVVGISVHLTFAERAYELARWYRARGSKVVLGGLHVISCPEECAPHGDALAIGDGVQVWGRILEDVEQGELQSVYRAGFTKPYREDPAPRRDLLPRESFLTTSSLIATRGCHNRCGFCYLSTKGLHMPYLMRDVAQIVEEFERDLYAEGYGKDGLIIDVRDNGGGSTADHLLAMLSMEPHAQTQARGWGMGYPQSRRPLYIWSKPIVLLINQNSFSNAEIFAHAVRTLGLGKLVGVPTAGGVISTGSVSFIDGSSMRMPGRGWFIGDTGVDMEGQGAEPDIHVEITPEDEAAGRDPQLSAAVEALLEELSPSP